MSNIKVLVIFLADFGTWHMAHGTRIFLFIFASCVKRYNKKEALEWPLNQFVCNYIEFNSNLFGSKNSIATERGIFLCSNHANFYPCTLTAKNE